MDINNIYRKCGKYFKGGGRGVKEKDKGREIQGKKGERDWGYFRTFKFPTIITPSFLTYGPPFLQISFILIENYER